MLGCPAVDGWQAGRRAHCAAARYCGSKVQTVCSRDDSLSGIPNERQKCAAAPNVTCISLQ
jgi:hypothetical protein